jgi:hypothetical protein
MGCQSDFLFFPWREMERFKFFRQNFKCMADFSDVKRLEIEMAGRRNKAVAPYAEYTGGLLDPERKAEISQYVERFYRALESGTLPMIESALADFYSMPGDSLHEKARDHLIHCLYVIGTGIEEREVHKIAEGLFGIRCMLREESGAYRGGKI